ncbi:protein POLR1D-like isoform X1 [Echinops telfairi]|uniref:Protein POLR1D-like isoform X1 n=1 Tax=Echinops telfairi TaxID=9371 RepID=A0ABM1VKY5_ECHTE|nr:protein POLR1D-like isoform X1 [Echinops telfairi]
MSAKNSAPSSLSPRKAIEELLKEAKRGKTRAETMGPMGWMKCPLAGTNKRFLLNTIKNTLPPHKEPDQEPQEGTAEPAESPPPPHKEESPRKRRPHPYRASVQRSRAGHSPPSSRKRSSHGKSHRRSNRR